VRRKAFDQHILLRPDICGAVSQGGQQVVVADSAAHDERVSSIVLPVQSTRAAGDVSMTASLLPDLEEFWPSRRCHAFDEFCR